MDVGGTIFYALELIGVFAFAVTGSITAIKRDLDVFGVTIMGITTALGGGVIRDILIGSLPPSMFYSYEYVLLAALTSLGIFTVAYVAKEKFSLNLELINFINNIFDAIGLGVFSVLGVSIAMGAGHSDNAFLCIFLGTLTGVGGGVLRDIMCSGVDTRLVHILCDDSLRREEYVFDNCRNACHFCYQNVSYAL